MGWWDYRSGRKADLLEASLLFVVDCKATWDEHVDDRESNEVDPSIAMDAYALMLLLRRIE